MVPLNAVMIFQWNLSYHHHHHPAFRAALSLWSSAFSPWAQSGRRCVRDRCKFIKKQLPVSSKRATEWETPPPTPQMPAASAGAAAVAVPGKEKHSTESHTSTHRFIHWWLKSSHYLHFLKFHGFMSFAWVASCCCVAEMNPELTKNWSSRTDWCQL